MIKATTKIGNTSVSVEAEDPKELFQAIGFFAEMPQKCGHCDSQCISPTHRKVKGYDFYSLKCGDCRYEFRFGQTKEDQSLFPKTQEGWVAPYSGGNSEPVFEEEEPRQSKPAPRHGNPAPRQQGRPAPRPHPTLTQEDEDDDLVPF